RDRPHAGVVLARARLVIRHLPDQVLGRHAGDVGGFRMALAGHQMARAASKPDPRAACYGFRCRGVFIGKPVRRIGGAGALTLPPARTAVGWTLSGMLNVQSGSPSGIVNASCAPSLGTMRSGARAHTMTATRR